MAGMYELAGAAGIAALIIALNWYDVYTRRSGRVRPPRFTIDSR